MLSPLRNKVCLLDGVAPDGRASLYDMRRRCHHRKSQKRGGSASITERAAGRGDYNKYGLLAARFIYYG